MTVFRNHFPFKWLAFASLSLLSTMAMAHGRWIIPSDTIVSGDTPTPVAVDFSISNDVFHPDYSYGGIPLTLLSTGQSEKRDLSSPRAKYISELMASTRFAVYAPDGSVDRSAAIVNLGRKSVSATALSQDGSYRFAVEQNPIYFTFYTDAEGELHREFGPVSDVQTWLPEGTTGIRGMKLVNRVESIVTRNAVSDIGGAASPRSGLDVLFEGHPNELFAGESAQVTVYFDGEPVEEGVTLKLTRGGTRWRNDREIIEVATNKSGQASWTWPQAGFYLLELELEKDGPSPDATKERYANYLSLEVNPE